MKTSIKNEFKFTDLNRPINRNRVEKLKESMKKHGYMSEFPVIINDSCEIIDGQHRYIAATELGIEYSYSIRDDESIMIDINTTQKVWNLSNYVNYYAKMGNEDYIKIQMFSKNYCTNTTEAIEILLNSITGGTALGMIKSGNTSNLDLTQDGINKAVDRALYINEVIKRLKFNRNNSSRLVRAILIIMKVDGFDRDCLLNKIEIQRDKIYKCTTSQGYLQMLEDIYNYHNTKKLVFLKQGR